MNDPVWLGNYIVPRWEAFLFVGGMVLVAVAALVTCIIVIGLVGALISWLVNPTARPGKQ